ncbi:MAG: type II secretion system protein GspK [Deltaproteobacteria bacterium]|nr:type II secretion system protein GspK [Deltaproteobacteria bacterium]
MKRIKNLLNLFIAPRKQNGIALIMVLWVLMILSVVVLEFSYGMRTETRITKNFQEEVQLYAMAEGGIQRAVVELIYKHDSRVQQKRKAQKDEGIAPEQQEWVTDGREYPLPYEGGDCGIRITGEAGKVNINSISESLLRKIIGNFGIEGEARDVVVDSILDWRDPDDFYRINGAENDYYRSLKDPYDCKNGNLDSIEELLLVRGVTPDLFYGKKPEKTGEGGGQSEAVGLKHVFSIYAAGEQIDINSVAFPVLRVVLGIPAEAARQVIKAREEKIFESQQDLAQRVPELTPFLNEVGRNIVYRSATSYYTIEAKARSKSGDGVRSLQAVVKIDPRAKEGYKIVQWVDAVY